MLKKFFDPSPPILTPRDIVTAMTGRKEGELALPKRAIITFSAGDLNLVVRRAKGALVEAWSPFKQLYSLEGSQTIATRSFIGGPAIAALTEELAAFGVEEMVLWGYCGALDPALALGDVIAARSALREDGASHHYPGDDPIVHSNWLKEWMPLIKGQAFHEGTIWSCDAIYREAKAKVARYRDAGISAVEMEVASFYSVTRYRNVRAIAFLVVSDLLSDEKWTPGFSTKQFREGARKLSRFVLDHALA